MVFDTIMQISAGLSGFCTKRYIETEPICGDFYRDGKWWRFSGEQAIIPFKTMKPVVPKMSHEDMKGYHPTNSVCQVTRDVYWDLQSLKQAFPLFEREMDAIQYKLRVIQTMHDKMEKKLEEYKAEYYMQDPEAFEEWLHAFPVNEKDWDTRLQTLGEKEKKHV